MKSLEQLQALQNMANYADSRITVHLIPNYADKRRTVPKFCANIGNVTISPTLGYSNLNHFLLGYSAAAKINATA